MSLAKSLLAGAAICALCTAPALSREAPNIHIASADTPLTMKVGSGLHQKTSSARPDVGTFTETLTFTGSLSFVAFKKTPTMLWGETWYDPSTCAAPTNEKGKFPRTTAIAKISTGTSTGNISGCGSTIFTFYGPIYDLKMKAKSDSFSGVIFAKKFNKYNLTLNVNTDLTITH
jgi:hypothetical protein